MAKKTNIKKVYLDKKAFVFLHDQLLEKMFQMNDREEPANVREKYGFLKKAGDPESSVISLYDLLAQNEQVAAYMQKFRVRLETRYSLYQNYLTICSPECPPGMEVGIDKHLLQCFLIFLGYETYNRYLEALEQLAPPVKYKALFYSRDFKVEHFDIEIDFYSEPWIAKMKNFHLDSKRPPFTGNAVRKGFNFYLNLECRERNNEEFHIASNVGNITDVSELEILPATFMGISTKGVPTGGECILVKNTDNVYNSEEGIKRIQAYLMLKRSRIHAKNSEIRSLDDITVMGMSVMDLDQIAGIYAVWGFDRRGNWYESKLTINPNTYYIEYVTTIFNNFPSLNRLRGEITISNIIQKNISLTTRSTDNKGREIVSHVMVDFSDLGSPEGIADGVFITISRHTSKPVAGHILIAKVNHDFSPRCLSPEDLAKLKLKYPQLEALDKRYIEYVRRNGG